MESYHRLGTAKVGADKSASQSTPRSKSGNLRGGLVVWAQIKKGDNDTVNRIWRNRAKNT